MYAEIIDTGQRIEVVGFVHHSRITWAVWRDDHGLLFEVPSYAIRMLPNVTDGTDDKVFTNMPSAARRNASTIQHAVNAVAGPSTVTPRGVR